MQRIIHRTFSSSANSNRKLFPLSMLVLALFAFCPITRGLDVDEIVTRHTEALGGKANLSALHSLRLAGKLSFGDGNFRIDLGWATWFKRPGMFREDASLQG